MRNALQRFMISTWRFLSTTWLIVGMSLVLLLLAETCYRAQGGARSALRAWRAGPKTAGPQDHLEWFEEFERESDASQNVHWKPYVYFRRFSPYSGKYVNLDSLAHRVTPQPATPAVPAARVFLFGGSTMWGTHQREDHTIAANVARRLQELAGPGARIEVTNFGETGYVFTQEIIELELQLRNGNRPDVVLFFDAINDVMALVQNGVPGNPQNERNRIADFELGRVLDQGGRTAGLGKDLKAFGTLAAKTLGELELVQRVQQVVATKPTLVAADSAIPALVRNYAGNIHLVEALAKEFGFTPVYVWQTTVHSTRKRLTPFEEGLMRTIDGDAAQSLMKKIHLNVPARLDSALAGMIPGRFVNQVGLFAGDTLPVFTDIIGHNTEVSIPTIVDGFWPALRDAVASHLRGPVPHR